METINKENIFKEYPDVLNAVDLCKMLGGISKKLAYRILKQNQIPSIRVGREYKIAKADVVNFIFQRENNSK